MALKTLKDLPTKTFALERPISITSFKENLRQEAIKWRKNIHQLWTEWFEERFREETTKKRFGEWLLDKIFDITEEDLMTNEEINKRENGEIGNN